MLKLHQFPAMLGLPNLSPFCMKVETYLRLADIPYEVVTTMDPGKAPKGKLPYIEDNGQAVADSSLIFKYLQKAYGNKLDDHLTEEQRDLGVALQRLIEDHLFYCGFYYRWQDTSNWAVVRESIFGKLPFFIKAWLPTKIRNKMQKQLQMQGMGRHTPSEVEAFAKEDLDIIAKQLAKHDFLVSDKVSSFDAMAYPYIAVALYAPEDSPIKAYLQAHPQFLAYCERMKSLANF